MIGQVLLLILQVAFSPPQCEEARSTVEMEECLERELSSLDTRLRERIEKIAERMSPRQRVLFDRAQRGWVLFRDLQCESEAAQYEGGSIAGVATLQCHVHRSRTRLEELASLY